MRRLMMPPPRLPIRPKLICKRYRRPPDYHVLGVLGALAVFGGLLVLVLLLFLALSFFLGLSSIADAATPASAPPLTTISPANPAPVSANPAPVSASSPNSQRYALAGANGYCWKRFWAGVEGDYSSELRDFLAKYYERHLGERKEWAQVRSLRVCGRIIVPGEATGAPLEFTLLKRKPNVCRMMMQRLGQVVYRVGYDGEDCWQLTADGLETMAPAKAGEFIRNASFTGYLLSPAKVVVGEVGGASTVLAQRMAANLRISFANPALVTWQGNPCQVLELDRPDGMRIRYYIDPETLLERAHEVYTVDGACFETVYMSDYRSVQGLLIPFQSEVWREGKQLQAIRVRSVQLNPGVMDWMFERPSVGGFSVYPKSGYLTPFFMAERQWAAGASGLPACPVGSAGSAADHAPRIQARPPQAHPYAHPQARPQAERSPPAS